jgi:hypothetical protein
MKVTSCPSKHTIQRKLSSVVPTVPGCVKRRQIPEYPLKRSEPFIELFILINVHLYILLIKLLSLSLLFCSCPHCMMIALPNPNLWNLCFENSIAKHELNQFTAHVSIFLKKASRCSLREIALIRAVPFLMMILTVPSSVSQHPVSPFALTHFTSNIASHFWSIVIPLDSVPQRSSPCLRLRV